MRKILTLLFIFLFFIDYTHGFSYAYSLKIINAPRSSIFRESAKLQTKPCNVKKSKTRVLSAAQSSKHDYINDKRGLQSRDRTPFFVWWKKVAAVVLMSAFCCFSAGADDELAKYAAEGNKVGVDVACFSEKCALQSKNCLGNPDCVQGLACLSKCKGNSLCSLGCFSKFGNSDLDNFLYCSIEKNGCVDIPRSQLLPTWDDPTKDKLAPPSAVSPFHPKSLEGIWYKTLGLDSRYDCFDCQQNTFNLEKQGSENVLEAHIKFRMPRQRQPGYFENNLLEDLLVDAPTSKRAMHTTGKMFGLTFWENWYVIGESDPSATKDLQYKFIYYTGHTLQESYQGAFVYTRSPTASPELFPILEQQAKAAGLKFSSFCKINNSCFDEPLGKESSKVRNQETKQSLPGKIYVTISDWFEDPHYLSEWLLNQQERVQDSALEAE